MKKLRAVLGHVMEENEVRKTGQIADKMKEN